MSHARFHGHRQQLRERFLRCGLEAFNDREAVELLLTLVIPCADVQPPASDLIARFGSLRGILDAPLEELRGTKGIGAVTPAALQIVRASAVLYLQQTAEQSEILSGTTQLESFWRMRIGALRNEVFEAAYLDSGLRLLRGGVDRLAEGTIDRATVYPRRIVECAVRRGAAAVVLAHNHPNGQVQPSEQDKTLTRAISLAASTIQLKVIDHLIVSPDDAFSFRRAGLL